MVNPPGKAELNVAHVRRHGYVFNVEIRKGSGTATVRARLPREWKGAVITSKGQAVQAGELKTGADGSRFYEFTVEANGPWIIVANTENTPDFSAIDRF